MIKPRRLRASVTIDKDGVSPDSIAAAQEYLLNALLELGNRYQAIPDWNTWRTYVHRRFGGDLRIVHYVKVIR